MGQMIRSDDMTRETLMKKVILAAVLLSSPFLLSGCVGLATGVGAAVGMAATKEGGLQTSLTDEAIRLKISDLWFKRSVEMFRKLNLNVNQGRVLLTGVVQNPEDRVEAIRLAWQPKGVKQVINEIRVGNPDNFRSYTTDAWISGQLRTRLTFEKYVQSVNYSIETVQGSVYLMGVAQHQRELDTVIRIARKIKGVKEVISYVKLAGEPTLSTSSATSATNSATVSAAPLAPVSEAPLSSSSAPTPITGGAGPAGIESEVLPP